MHKTINKMLIDTHSHVYLPEFDHDRYAMIHRAKEANVCKILMPNIDNNSIEQMHQVHAVYPDFCLPMMGLHPCSVQNDMEEQLLSMELFLTAKNQLRYYGIGECGLDYYWDTTKIEQQKIAFQRQIDWAKKYELPLIIHSRDAIDDCISMIEKNKDDRLRGVFHCFSGSLPQLEAIINLQFYAGIGGVATFKNGGLNNVLQINHLPHLLLETDAPYLSPIPYRGKRNEPSFLPYISKKISEMMMVEVEEIERITTKNAMQLFML